MQNLLCGMGSPRSRIRIRNPDHWGKIVFRLHKTFEGGGAFRSHDIIPSQTLLEINIQFLILRAGQGIPYRSKTLDAVAARLAP